MPAPEPEIDDITPELEEDDAFAAFAIGEASGVNTAQPARDLFDIESAEDLTIDPEPQRFKSDFDPDVLDEPLTVDRFANTFEPELPVEVLLDMEQDPADPLLVDHPGVVPHARTSPGGQGYSSRGAAA